MKRILSYYFGLLSSEPDGGRQGLLARDSSSRHQQIRLPALSFLCLTVMACATPQTGASPAPTKQASHSRAAITRPHYELSNDNDSAITIHTADSIHLGRVVSGVNALRMTK
jgi:hypothetical protein